MKKLYFSLGLIIAILVAYQFFALRQLTNERHFFVDQFQSESVWHLSQAKSDLLKLINSVYQHSYNDVERSLAEVLMALDIAYVRVDSLGTEEEGWSDDTRESFSSAIHGAKQTLLEVEDSLMAGQTLDDKAPMRIEVIRKLETLVQRIFDLTLQMKNGFNERYDERQQKMVEIYNQTVFIMGSAVVVGLFLMAFSFSSYRSLYRLRLQLESRVEERTRELSMLSQAMEQSTAPIAIVDREGKIAFHNDCFRSLFSLSKHESDVRHPLLNDNSFGLKLSSALTRLGSECDFWSREFEWKKDNSRSVFLSVRASCIRNDEGEANFILVTHEDITHIKLHERELKLMARSDALTQLPNRLAATEKMERSIRCVGEDDQKFAVLMLDLDQFKKINDSRGHAFGDQLIRQVAQRAKEIVGERAMVSRLGGDEFLLVSEVTDDIADVSKLVNDIYRATCHPYAIENTPVYCSSSIGVSVFPRDGATPNTLMRKADLALYAAKDKGRNDIVYFDPQLEERMKRRSLVENQMRHALQRNEFSLKYQPIMDVNSGHMAGCEALIRWENPELGMVSPVEFIPIAEELGEIVEIGRWVLDQACAFVAKNYAILGHNFYISVNVSAKQLAKGDFVDIYRSVIDKHKLKPEQTALEITENLSVGQDKSVISQLSALRALGATLSIDDFGTGYSSLSYLHSLPANVIKIDQSFVRDNIEKTEKQSLLKAMYSMADSLGMRVIVEGVETYLHVSVLQSIGFTYMQGYHFARPKDPNDLLADIVRGDFTVDAGIRKKHLAAVHLFKKDC